MRGLAGSCEFPFHPCGVLGEKCNVGARAEPDWDGGGELREAWSMV